MVMYVVIYSSRPQTDPRVALFLAWYDQQAPRSTKRGYSTGNYDRPARAPERSLSRRGTADVMLQNMAMSLMHACIPPGLRRWRGMPAISVSRESREDGPRRFSRGYCRFACGGKRTTKAVGMLGDLRWRLWGFLIL
jgi:hypothetical protein